MNIHFIKMNVISSSFLSWTFIRLILFTTPPPHRHHTLTTHVLNLYHFRRHALGTSRHHQVQELSWTFKNFIWKQTNPSPALVHIWKWLMTVQEPILKYVKTLQVLHFQIVFGTNGILEWSRDHNELLRYYYHKKKSGQTEPKSWTNRKLGRSGIRYPDDPDKRGFKENHAIWTKLNHFRCLEGCSSIWWLLWCWLLRYRIQWLQRSWSWGILLWRNYFNTFR